jgi:hypothetical protein
MALAAFASSHPISGLEGSGALRQRGKERQESLVLFLIGVGAGCDRAIVSTLQIDQMAASRFRSA